jgi:hypothetical protein
VRLCEKKSRRPREKKERPKVENRDAKKFQELMTLCGEVYGHEPSKAMIRLYWDVLKQYPMADVEACFQRVLGERVFSGFPKPAEFLTLIAPKEAVEDRARIVYRKFQERLSDVGVYANWQISDGALAEVIRHYGGLVQYNNTVREMDDRALMFHEKDFCDLYRIYSAHAPTGPQFLIGLQVQTNRQLGYEVEEDRKAIADDGALVQIEAPPTLKQLMRPQEDSRSDVA